MKQNIIILTILIALIIASIVWKSYICTALSGVFCSLLICSSIGRVLYKKSEKQLDDFYSQQGSES